MTDQTHGDETEAKRRLAVRKGKERSVPCELFRPDATQEGMRGGRQILKEAVDLTVKATVLRAMTLVLLVSH